MGTLFETHRLGVNSLTNCYCRQDIVKLSSGCPQLAVLSWRHLRLESDHSYQSETRIENDSPESSTFWNPPTNIYQQVTEVVIKMMTRVKAISVGSTHDTCTPQSDRKKAPNIHDDCDDEDDFELRDSRSGALFACLKNFSSCVCCQKCHWAASCCF